MAAARAWLLAAALGAAGPGAAEAVTPIQKALQLMKEMQQKCVKDQETEAVRYSAFKQFCNGTDAAKSGAIHRASRRVEKLDADIAKAAADVETMGARVAELQEDVARWGKDEKAVAEIRRRERADYTATRDEYVNAVAVCDRAVDLLRSLAHKDRAKQAALVAHNVKVAKAAAAAAKARANLSTFDIAMRADVMQFKAAEAQQREAERGAQDRETRRRQAAQRAKRARQALAAALDDAAGQVGVADLAGRLASAMPQPWWRRSHGGAAAAAPARGPPAAPTERRRPAPAEAALVSSRSSVAAKALATTAASSLDAQQRAELHQQRELAEDRRDLQAQGQAAATAAASSLDAQQRAELQRREEAEDRRDLRALAAGVQGLERKEAQGLAAEARALGASLPARAERDAAVAALDDASQREKVAGASGPLVAADFPYLPRRSGAVALLQYGSSEEPNPLLFKEAPDAYSYQAHSRERGGVLDMLLELRARFIEEQTDLEKEELNAVHAHEALRQRLHGQVSQAESEIGFKEKRVAERQGELAASQGEKQELEVALDDDQKYLRDLRGLCAQKSLDFEARQKIRAEEMEALAKAVEILTGSFPAEPAATAAAPGVALVQVGRDGGARPEQQRVASMLAARAAALGSRDLAAAAKSAKEDPFGKVKKMIRDLITRMMEELHAMAEHEGWCDTEMGTNALTRRDKAEAADEAAAELDRLENKRVKLTQDVEDLQEEIGQLASALATATEERAGEKAEHERSIEEAKDGQTAVAQALAVLRDFYERNAEATALTQEARSGQSPTEDAPETWTSSYKGQGQSASVIGMLEVVQADFEHQQVTAETAEMEAVAAFKKFAADSDRETAVLQTTLEAKQRKVQETESLMASTSRSLDQTQKELEAANVYYEKLKSACLAKVDFDERNRKREEEIESLTDAYKILSGEDLPSVQEMKAEQIGSQ